MFTHIVLWRLKESAAGRTRDANARLITERFEELANMLDGLRRLDVGLGLPDGDDAAHVSIVMEFDSREAFQAYYDHPAHKDLAAFIRAVREDRRVIDYER